MKKEIIFILIIIIGISAVSTYKSSTFSVVNIDTCFTDEDCRIQVEKDFCDVEFRCVEGKCASRQVECPIPDEVCYSGIDEDEDGLIGCKDPDCFNSIYCPCENAVFSTCRPGGCYCGIGTRPRWVVSETNYCICSG